MVPKVIFLSEKRTKVTTFGSTNVKLFFIYSEYVFYKRSFRTLLTRWARIRSRAFLSWNLQTLEKENVHKLIKEIKNMTWHALEGDIGSPHYRSLHSTQIMAMTLRWISITQPELSIFIRKLLIAIILVECGALWT